MVAVGRDRNTRRAHAKLSCCVCSTASCLSQELERRVELFRYHRMQIACHNAVMQWHRYARERAARHAGLVHELATLPDTLWQPPPAGTVPRRTARRHTRLSRRDLRAWRAAVPWRPLDVDKAVDVGVSWFAASVGAPGAVASRGVGPPGLPAGITGVHGHSSSSSGVPARVCVKLCLLSAAAPAPASPAGGWGDFSASVTAWLCDKLRVGGGGEARSSDWQAPAGPHRLTATHLSRRVVRVPGPKARHAPSVRVAFSAWAAAGRGAVPSDVGVVLFVLRCPGRGAGAEGPGAPALTQAADWDAEQQRLRVAVSATEQARAVVVMVAWPGGGSALSCAADAARARATVWQRLRLHTLGPAAGVAAAQVVLLQAPARWQGDSLAAVATHHTYHSGAEVSGQASSGGGRWRGLHDDTVMATLQWLVGVSCHMHALRPVRACAHAYAQRVDWCVVLVSNQRCLPPQVLRCSRVADLVSRLVVDPLLRRSGYMSRRCPATSAAVRDLPSAGPGDWLARYNAGVAAMYAGAVEPAYRLAAAWPPAEFRGVQSSGEGSTSGDEGDDPNSARTVSPFAGSTDEALGAEQWAPPPCMLAPEAAGAVAAAFKHSLRLPLDLPHVDASRMRQRACEMVAEHLGRVCASRSHSAGTAVQVGVGAGEGVLYARAQPKTGACSACQQAAPTAQATPPPADARVAAPLAPGSLNQSAWLADSLRMQPPRRGSLMSGSGGMFQPHTVPPLPRFTAVLDASEVARVMSWLEAFVNRLCAGKGLGSGEGPHRFVSVPVLLGAMVQPTLGVEGHGASANERPVAVELNMRVREAGQPLAAALARELERYLAAFDGEHGASVRRVPYACQWLS